MVFALVMMAGMAALDDPSLAAIEPPVISTPHWLTPPNGDDVTDLYPAAAYHAHLEGAASVRCVVTVKGYLTSCEVVIAAGFDALAHVAGDPRRRSD